MIFNDNDITGYLEIILRADKLLGFISCPHFK